MNTQNNPDHSATTEPGPFAGGRIQDGEVFHLIKQETLRQELVLRLIPSENYASKPVREATGSILTNKYSEGLPGRRYYQGQEYIDKLENLCIERAKAVFNGEHANVQPYSGSIAVLACYFAVCQAGDTVMGPRLDHGGHLSHGHKVNLTGKLFKMVQYGVNQQTEVVDLDEVREQARQARPKMIIVGGTAFPRNFDFPGFAAIAKEVGAVLVADMSHTAGLIAGKAHPQPFPHVDIMVTTSHKTLRGPRGAFIVCKRDWAAKIDTAVFPLLQGGPHQHTQAGVGVALFEAQQPAFREYAANIVRNSKALAQTLMEGGLRLISKGTDNHLILADVTSMGWEGGKPAAVAMEKAGIELNANMIPFDKGSALKPSGIRLGTPALTTRGMGPEEMKIVGDLMLQVLRDPSANEDNLRRVRARVQELCLAFPVPDYFV